MIISLWVGTTIMDGLSSGENKMATAVAVGCFVQSMQTSGERLGSGLTSGLPPWREPCLGGAMAKEAVVEVVSKCQT